MGMYVQAMQSQSDMQQQMHLEQQAQQSSARPMAAVTQLQEQMQGSEPSSQQVSDSVPPTRAGERWEK